VPYPSALKLAQAASSAPSKNDRRLRSSTIPLQPATRRAGVSLKINCRDLLIHKFIVVLSATLLATLPTSAFGDLLHFRLLPKESSIVTQILDPFGKTVVGKLALIGGEVRGDVKELSRSASVSLTMDAESYNSNLGLRDEDVRDNYLEVKQYPHITFRSSSVEAIKQPESPGSPWQLTIKGVLELHGIKREISVPVRLTHRERKIIVEGNTKILLKDFNIAVPTLLFTFRSGDVVEVGFRIVGEEKT